MLKKMHNEVWAFDAEWVPDPISGRIAYGLSSDLTDDQVREIMWEKAGATPDNPRPYLKTALCRVVSIAAVVRRQAADGTVSLLLRAIPSQADKAMTEAEILDRFLSAIGKAKPQLVGFNSNSADLVILIQRAVAQGLHQPQFCSRPDKPWEGVDYFSRQSDWSIDLKETLGGWGKGTPSLHELASSCGIPGKIDTDGGDVVDLWRSGKLKKIVAYNECDALTTYLVWLRLAHFAGFVTSEGYAAEQEQLRGLLREKVREQAAAHLAIYLGKWQMCEEIWNSRAD